MRDHLYEKSLLRHQEKMCRILDEYKAENSTLSDRDYLAIQRALQILIESMIGMARYIVHQKYHIAVHKSREALDELRSREELTEEVHGKLMKIIGFRNVLVHDYLEINNDVVIKIIDSGAYHLIVDTTIAMSSNLNED